MKPDPNELEESPQDGLFAQSRESQGNNRVTTIPMQVEIEKIEPYRNNPRQLPNPLYARIKASIRAKRGLDDPIGITQRPGDEHFTVRAGGNTRLAILKELFEETGDPAFWLASCLFVPWTSESDCIASHLIENALRGNLSFLDKARAVVGLLAQLETEHGPSESRNADLRRLAAIGYPVSKRQLIRYTYTAERLAKLIPEALEAGLGARKIDAIHEAEQTYRDFWEACGLNAGTFDSVFEGTFAQHDSDGFSLTAVLEDLELEISKTIGKPCQQVRMAVDARRANPESQFPIYTMRSNPSDPKDCPLQSGSEFVESHSDGSFSQAEKPKISKSTRKPVQESTTVKPVGPSKPLANEDRALNEDTPTTEPGENTQPDSDSGNANEIEAELEEIAPFETRDFEAGDVPSLQFLSTELNVHRGKLPQTTDLKSLRSRAWVLAQRFAQSVHCPAVVRQARQGFGFFVDLPAEPICERGEIAWWGWWLLFSVSEQAVTKERLKLAPNDMRLPSLLIADRIEDVLRTTGDPPDRIQHLGHALFNAAGFPERAFEDLFLLIETCRTLRLGFAEQHLWSCPSVAELRGLNFR